MIAAAGRDAKRRQRQKQDEGDAPGNRHAALLEPLALPRAPHEIPAQPRAPQERVMVWLTRFPPVKERVARANGKLTRETPFGAGQLAEK